jgi:hypothetical protein
MRVMAHADEFADRQMVIPYITTLLVAGKVT